jgi:hypothetical protein
LHSDITKCVSMTGQDSLNNIGVNFRGSILAINKNCVFVIILLLFSIQWSLVDFSR